MLTDGDAPIIDDVIIDLSIYGLADDVELLFMYHVIYGCSLGTYEGSMMVV